MRIVDLCPVKMIPRGLDYHDCFASISSRLSVLKKLSQLALSHGNGRRFFAESTKVQMSLSVAAFLEKISCRPIP